MEKNETGIKVRVIKDLPSVFDGLTRLKRNYRANIGGREMFGIETEQDADVDSIIEWCVNWLRSAEAVASHKRHETIWYEDIVDDRMSLVCDMLEQAGY